MDKEILDESVLSRLEGPEPAVVIGLPPVEVKSPQLIIRMFTTFWMIWMCQIWLGLKRLSWLLKHRLVVRRRTSDFEFKPSMLGDPQTAVRAHNIGSVEPRKESIMSKGPNIREEGDEETIGDMLKKHAIKIAKGKGNAKATGTGRGMLLRRKITSFRL